MYMYMYTGAVSGWIGRMDGCDGSQGGVRYRAPKGKVQKKNEKKLTNVSFFLSFFSPNNSLIDNSLSE